MSLFKSLVVGAVLAQGALAMPKVKGGDDIISNGNSCPDGWSFTQIGSEDPTYCCYGSSVVENDKGYCCVNAQSVVTHGKDWKSSIDIGDETSTYSDCYPFCDKKNKRDIGNFSRSCAATVSFGEDDYSSKVSSASKSVNAEATKGSNSPAKNSADATSDGDKPSKTDDSSSDSSDTSDNAGMPMITGDAMLKYGGAAVAAAMLAL